MANTLRFKRGLASGIPTAVAGEPLFTTDTFDLYIGNGTTNTRFQKYIASGTTSQLLRGDGSLLTMPIVLTSPANGEVLKYNGTNWVNSSDAGITGSGAAGQVAYFTSATTQAGNNNLFWDNTNGRLGVGTVSPQTSLDISNNLMFGNISAFPSATYDTSIIIARTEGSGSAPFNNAGSIVYRARVTSTALRSDHIFYTGSPSTEKVRIFATGNFGINTGATDSGQKLQVTGDTLLKGSGNTGGTIGLSVQNSDGNLMLGVFNSGQTVFSPNGQRGLLYAGDAFSFATPSLTNQSNIVISNSRATSAAIDGVLIITREGTETSTVSGSTFLKIGHRALQPFAPTSGSATFAAIQLNPVINQVGSTGITRGLLILPTLTAAADWRSIEWSNNTGWGLYGAGTSRNYLNGNLAVGFTGYPWQSATKAIDLGTVGGLSTDNNYVALSNNWYWSGTTNTYKVSDFATQYVQQDGKHIWSSAASGTAGNAITFTQAMTLTANGRLLLNKTSDTGEQFQVIGSANISGALSAGIGTFNATGTSYATGNLKLNNSTGTSTVYMTNASGTFYLSTTGSTDHFTISPTGAATFSGNLTVDTNTLFVDATNNRVGIGTVSPTVALEVTGSARISDAIAIGTTPDTNNPFKILKNINSTVGIRFENTNTSSAAFSAVQLGTDITGGTKFTNLVYSSSGVVATGVYNPDGTSLINNGSGGLNFLGTPFRIYTGTGNGTLRILFDNEGTTQINATTPTTNAVDGYKQYSADVTAGNAAPHFRTENGAVIKLYQETTGVGNAIFSAGGGNSVLDDSTFDGYTLRQIVKALRNQGILA